MKAILFIIVVLIIGASFVVALNNDRRVDTRDNEDITNNQDTNMTTLKLTSSSFEHNDLMPSRYTCDGEGINPNLKIEGIPESAKSLVLIMDDPDAPTGTWDHWVKFNVSTTTKEIKEATEPEGLSGAGTAGNDEYRGPCPPDREHRYFFKLYALDTELALEEGVTKKEVEKAMEGHILDQAELIGRYERISE